MKHAIQKMIDPNTMELVTKFHDGTCSRTGNMNKLLKYINEYEVIKQQLAEEGRQLRIKHGRHPNTF